MLDCEQSLFCSKIRAGRTAKPERDTPAHATRGSRLAAREVGFCLSARGSRLRRLKYRTRFLAAPPAGFLEQKRD